MLAPMISYAQNGEDVVLRRAFADQAIGFYVDVGAGDPVEDSVTLYFYEQGWHGVNIDPDPVSYNATVRARPRDVNLNAAVGVEAGTATFYPSRVRGHGTLDVELAATDDRVSPIEVRQVSLRQVFDEHAPLEGVDFLKVDVEGWEASVLASTDWKGVRPRVVLVEAVDPSGTAAHNEWETMLLEKSYRFALFDGLNRFYCREEDAAELMPRLAAPANVQDNWRLAREVRLHEACERRASELEAALDAERAALEAERDANAGPRALLAEMHDSLSWRITAPLRDASRLVKVMRRGPQR